MDGHHCGWRNRASNARYSEDGRLRARYGRAMTLPPSMPDMTQVKDETAGASRRPEDMESQPTEQHSAALSSKTTFPLSPFGTFLGVWAAAPPRGAWPR